MADPNLGSYNKAFRIRELDTNPGWEGRTPQNVFPGLNGHFHFKNASSFLGHGTHVLHSLSWKMFLVLFNSCLQEAIPPQQGLKAKTFTTKSHPTQQKIALSFNLHILCSSLKDTAGKKLDFVEN